MRKLIFIMCVLSACTQSFKDNSVEEFDILSKKSFDDYIDEGFERVWGVDILMVEKKFEGFTHSVEFYNSKDLDNCNIKRWTFELDSSFSIEDNVINVLKKYNISYLTSLCADDTSHYHFSGLTTSSNIMLTGRVIKTDYEKTINLYYYPPKVK